MRPHPETEIQSASSRTPVVQLVFIPILTSTGVRLLQLSMLLFVVSASELRNRTIPSSAIAFLVLLALVDCLAGVLSWAESIAGALAALIATILARVAAGSANRPAVGGGDVALATATGLLLGPGAGSIAIAAACTLAIVEASVTASTLRIPCEAGVRFGPYVVAGAILASIP